jgi:hypothetical protein
MTVHSLSCKFPQDVGIERVADGLMDIVGHTGGYVHFLEQIHLELWSWFVSPTTQLFGACDTGSDER